ncbi:MAG TPA: hypothetical protein VGK54_09805 [Chloroflexota bacterium]|jgi:hypothetical protein
MARVTDQVLADCLDEMMSGRQTLEECLTTHPGIADELRPLLEIAQSLAYPAAAEPDPSFRSRGRLMLAEALDDRVAVPSHSFRGVWTAWVGNWGMLPRASARMAAAAAAALVLIGAVGVGSIYASQDALPGEPLYLVKATFEGLARAATEAGESLTAVAALIQPRRATDAAQAAPPGTVAISDERLPVQDTEGAPSFRGDELTTEEARADTDSTSTPPVEVGVTESAVAITGANGRGAQPSAGPADEGPSTPVTTEEVGTKTSTTVGPTDEPPLALTAPEEPGAAVVQLSVDLSTQVTTPIAGLPRVEAAAQPSPSPAGSAAASTPEARVNVCHATGSRTNPFVPQQIGAAAVDAHRAQGDIIGVQSPAACAPLQSQ